MQFVDEVSITVRSGNGGNGCVSFRREKFVPRGGPDGGDGGNGADVVLVAEPRLTTLLDLRYQRQYRGRRGGNGGGSDCHGKNAPHLIIPLPCGSVIEDEETGELIADLTQPGQTVIAAHGGRGGLGNAHFKTSTNRAPRQAQPGGEGEEKRLKIVLKLLADVGLIGLPNAGKSTLLSRISAARPKVADYPFTTKTPVLGVVRAGGDRSFVVADLPGLIEGAAEGRGLGHRFLKHAERTRVLLHLVDCTSDDPKRDMKLINHELASFHPELGRRRQLVVLTKTDLLPGRQALKPALQSLRRGGRKVLSVSAVSGDGLDQLVRETAALLFAADQSAKAVAP